MQTVQVEGSSNNTITLNGLRGGTTYNITVRAYQQLLGPASSAISVWTHCSGKSYINSMHILIFIIDLYLLHNEQCYFNGSYFWNTTTTIDSKLNCILPNTDLTSGEWIQVGKSTSINCDTSNETDPFLCTNDTSPDATLSLYLPDDTDFSNNNEGLYKCCLPTNCSDTNTNIIFANIFSKYIID